MRVARLASAACFRQPPQRNSVASWCPLTLASAPRPAVLASWPPLGGPAFPVGGPSGASALPGIPRPLPARRCLLRSSRAESWRCARVTRHTGTRIAAIPETGACHLERPVTRLLEVRPRRGLCGRPTPRWPPVSTRFALSSAHQRLFRACLQRFTPSLPCRAVRWGQRPQRIEVLRRGDGPDGSSPSGARRRRGCRSAWWRAMRDRGSPERCAGRRRPQGGGLPRCA